MATLRKTKDLVFGGRHPNNINVGYERRSVSPTINLPVIGENYYFSGLTTSQVTTLHYAHKGGFSFSTQNSTYVVEY